MEWKVRKGTQVNYDGKLYAEGETFSATEAQVSAAGVSFYVEKAEERKTSKAADKGDSKAQQSSQNKAQQAPDGNKSPDKGK